MIGGFGSVFALQEALEQHTMMLQCLRRESATCGHSAHEKTNI
jgi:hypothetical protein